MASHEYELAEAPSDPRRRELWLQHAAGKIIFEDARQYAIEQISEDLNADVREAVIAGIDDAIYGMMMIFDGVSGSLRNENTAVGLEVKVQLSELSDETEKLLDEVNLAEGDGMCLGFHGWMESDFGADPVATKIED